MEKDPGSLKSEIEKAESETEVKTGSEKRKSKSEAQGSSKSEQEDDADSLEKFIKEATTTVSSVKIKSEEKPKRKKSFVLQKFFDLEKELTFDNIQMRVQNIFQPGEPAKSITDDGIVESIEGHPPNQLSSGMAAMFIVSCTTGAEMSSLPFALMQSSWFGVFLIILLGVNALYAGLCTGWSWKIMEEKWPEYKKYRRVPYEDIAHRAVGIWMKYITAVLIVITLIVTCSFYAIWISLRIEALSGNFSACWGMIVTVCFLTPFMGFSYYRNMKFLGVLSTVASLLFPLLVIIGMFLDPRSNTPHSYADPTYESVALAFATFAFAYGNGPIYPSIMTDMEDRTMFPHACGTAYLIILIIYIFMPIIVYAAYGDEHTVKNITSALISVGDLYRLGLTIEIVQIIQVGSSFVIYLLPTMHAFEERFNCPIEFCWRRMFIRLIIMLFILLLILGVPFLGKFVNFVGAILLNILTYVFPPLFYVCLIHQRVSLFSKTPSGVSKKGWFMLIEMFVLAIVVAVISTYVSVQHYLKSGTNREACYFNPSIPEQKQSRVS